MCPVAVIVGFFTVDTETKYCTTAELLVVDVDTVPGISYGLSTAV